MLPRVRELEHRFADVLIAIGVHAGKYIAERKTPNIAEACFRLGVQHPVVNDRQYRIWRAYAVQAWPTLIFLDPRGYVVASQAGELPLEPLTEFVERLVRRYDDERALSREVFTLIRTEDEAPTGVIRFPGKVALGRDRSVGSNHAPGRRLFVADTGHHSVLEVALETEPRGRVARRFGGSEPGFVDGANENARFREPQGLTVSADALFVADRANHSIRRVALATGEVETVAGTGELGSRPRPGPGRETSLRSPWDVLVHDRMLYIAMAGSHQIWKWEIATGQLRVHAGSGAESIDDGPLAKATLAQPSGLATDGNRLYFADSESSAIRWADFDEDGQVRTIVGRGLFDFGDRDGEGDDVRLQHPLGMAWHAAGLLVADTYNGKIKRVDPAGRTAVTLRWELWTGRRDVLGEARKPSHDGPTLSGAERSALSAGKREASVGESSSTAPLNEPGGLAIDDGFLYVADTGNHRIVRLSLETGRGEVIELFE
jgi:sugar lactone lactonase YvrE